MSISKRSSTVSSRRRRATGAAKLATVTLMVVTAPLTGSPSAYAINRPVIDPGAVPPDSTPGPEQPMRQSSYCTEVEALPGTDFRLQPKYMDMLNLPEAWKLSRGEGMTVAVIDTGVTPHPRLPRLKAGGDYLMAGGDGLSDCDAHGTIVASMIAATPADGAVPAALPPRRPPTVPTNEPPPPPPPPPPPQTVTLVAPPPQTVFVTPDPPQPEGAAAQPTPPPAKPSGSDGRGAVLAPNYSGGARVVTVDRPNPGEPAPPLPPPAPAARRKPPPPRAEKPPAPPAPTDAFSGVAPAAEVLSIRQSSQAFSPKNGFTDDRHPQVRQKMDSVHGLARAIVHAAKMGAEVINISDVTCMSVRNLVDQRELGAAVRYAAVDRDAVIVSAAGDTNKHDCKQNPTYNPLRPNDPRDWGSVNTVVTPAWFDDYVLTVGAVDSAGVPMAGASVAGPWVSIAAPGTDIVGLSARDDGLINAIEGSENTLLVPAGTGFAAAIVSGVAALVRAKYPGLSAHQVINRLISTARSPARGVDNQVGHGIVDPVAALTWDVPEGAVLAAEKKSSSPLALPPPPPGRDMAPVWVAVAGLVTTLLAAAAALIAAAMVRRSPRHSSRHP